MAEWRVSKEVVEVKEHPNADALDVLKVGEYQIVSRKENYKTGDVVVIIPEKSVIPKDSPIYEEYEKYLTGPNKDRVKGIRLRGEMSEAITWPVDKLAEAVRHEIDNTYPRLPLIDMGKFMTDVEVLQDAAIGEDISEYLGIIKYEAPIPYNMKGEVEQFDAPVRKHDVYQFASYADEIGNQVMITEKIHGSQINYFLLPFAEEKVSSKGMLKKGLALKEDEKNVYWQAARNSDLKRVASEIQAQLISDTNVPHVIQLIGEVIPVQKGFDYGQTQKVVKLFDIVIDGHYSMPFSQIPQSAFDLWVPIIHIGPLDYDKVNLTALSKGKEQVSGEERHIREGIVIKHIGDKKAEDGKRLVLKVINPKYKDDDSFN